METSIKAGKIDVANNKSLTENGAPHEITPPEILH